ncbi:hypothetical protein ACVNF4_08540 [Streptomyces sp. S6]
MSDRPEPSRVMTAQEVDEKLAAMQRAAGVLLREWEEAERRLTERSELSEARVRRAQRPGRAASPFEAESVLESVRLKLAADSAKGYGDAVRDFVCWWVDAAGAAWQSAALGTPLSYTRWGAVTPHTVMFDDELALLPRAAEQARQLVELEDFLDPPIPGFNQPEERRRRLWGDLWAEHRIPLLPTTDELDLLLSHTPDAAAHRLRDALRAIIEAAMAKPRIDELEDKEGPWDPSESAEYDRLDALLDELTHRLADYARVLTDVLPEVRAVNV